MDSSESTLHTAAPPTPRGSQVRVTHLYSADVPQPSSAEDPGLIGVLDLLKPIIRRRWLLLVCTLVGLLAGMLWTLRKGDYVAFTTVLPPQSSVTSSLLGQIGGLANLVGGAGLSGGHGSNDLYVSLLQTPSVQDAVVRRFHLQQVYGAPTPFVARIIFAQHTTVDGFGRDGMIRIFFNDAKDPKRAAAVANGYVEEFMKFMSHLAVSEAGQRRAFFEQQMDEEKDKLADAEEAMRKLEQKTGALQLDAQTRMLLDTTTGLRAQVTAKQVEIQSIRSYAGPDNINLQRAEHELAALQAQLAKVTSAGDPTEAAALSHNALPQTALENIRAQREVKSHEAILGILSNQYEAARLDEAREGGALQVVEPATPPEGRTSVPSSRKILIGSLVGLFLGLTYVMLAYAWERLKANRMFAGKLNELSDVYARGE
ncbi:GumC family protein [Terriglobus aquaticus]|uniref:GumC family protein n=1 Tax=Terriglobus aquaticus TaxID=940139 RepID=A0ABW9KLF8_9BACT|nr:chain length determinant family protein [Terriglobus aquaticus]